MSVVLVGEPGDPAGAGFDALPPEWTISDARHWSEDARDLLAHHPHAALVACGDPESIERARLAAPADRAFHAWPTRLVGDPAHDARALDWGIAALAPGISSRSTLWDGDYLLVPGSPGPGIAEAILGAFESIADDFPALDLVFLGELTPRQARVVRSGDVHRRVHGAGAAPLRAECAWLAGASLVLLPAESEPESSAVIRALASGTPVLVPGEDATAATLGAWLDEHGLRVSPAGRGLDAMIVELLTHAPAARAATGRAASWARGRERDQVSRGMRARRDGASRAA